MPQTNKGIYTCMYKHLNYILSLPTYNSASEMFAVLNIPSFGELIRKFAFSFMSRMSSSINVFMVNIYNSSVPLFSKIWGWWYSIWITFLFPLRSFVCILLLHVYGALSNQFLCILYRGPLRSALSLTI